MSINYSKNIHFSDLIKVEGRLHEFNFLQRNPDLYEADTSDEYGGRYIFKVVRENEGWQILGEDLPAWIADNTAIITAVLNQRQV